MPPCNTPPPPPPTTATNKVNAVYWPVWLPHAQLDRYNFENVTHVLIAFANPKLENGKVVIDCGPSSEHLSLADRLFRLKERHTGLKLLLSIGGWTWSQHFSQIAQSPEFRRQFGHLCGYWVETLGLDGVDIDWEYPTRAGAVPNTASPLDLLYLNELLVTVRQRLDGLAATKTSKPRFLLTMAWAADPQLYNQDPRASAFLLAERLDLIFVMTYDRAGDWSERSGFHCGFRWAESILRAFGQLNIPYDKLVLGIPLYGRAFLGATGPNQVFRAGGRPYQPFRELVDRAYKVNAEEQAAEVQVPEAGWTSFIAPENVRASVRQPYPWRGCFFWEQSMDKGLVALTGSLIKEQLDRSPACFEYPKAETGYIREALTRRP